MSLGLAKEVRCSVRLDAMDVSDVRSRPFDMDDIDSLD
jgi:hypothetical protein